MQINLSPVNFTNMQNNKNVCFKAIFDDEGYFGDDGDIEGQKVRDAIRDRIYSRCFVPVRESESTNPEMKYARTIEDVHIDNFRSLGNYSYSGESLMHHPEFFELLHPSGVAKVIDLINDKRVEEQCKKHGLEYVPYDMYWGYGNNPIFYDENELIAKRAAELAEKGLTKKEYDIAIEGYKKEIEEKKDKYINKFAGLINKLNLGQFYMACEYGEFRTLNCLALISTFNPGWTGERIKPSYEYCKKFQNLYNNLTPKYKSILGINEEYNKYLRNYIEKLKYAV